MSTNINITLPKEIAGRLSGYEDDLPAIIDYGLKHRDTPMAHYFAGEESIFEFLASLPAPEEVLAFKPDQAFQERVSFLLAKNRELGLSEDEAKEWERYDYLEHLVRLAKVRAYKKIEPAEGL